MRTESILRRVAMSVCVLAGAGVGLAASPAPSRSLVLQTPPAASVNSVAVSPDGSLVASGASEGGVRLYDARTGQLLRVFGGDVDRSVVFSPDGQTLAAAGFHLDKLVKLVDVRTGNIVRKFAGHSQIETCATRFSPDGKLLASAGRDSEILVWDVSTAALRHRIDEAPAVALAFSPDSATLATGGCDRTIRLWDMKTGQLQRLLMGHSDCVSTLAFSPDGQSIASGSCDWANHRGRNTAEFAWRDPGCVSQWMLWDATSGEIKRTVSVPGRLLTLAFEPGGKSLACAVGKNIQLYDLQKETPGRVIASHDFDATSVAFTPDGAAFVSGSHDQIVNCVSIATGKIRWRAPGYFEQVNSLALSTDGTLLVTGSSDRRFAVRTLPAGSKSLQPGATRIWDARTGRLLRRVGDLTEQVMAVAVSADGTRVASGGVDSSGSGVVHQFDAATGAAVWSVDDHAGEVLALAYAPDETTLASAAADGVIKLRDPQTGSVRRALADHEGGATSITFSADGTTLVCGLGTGGVRAWDARTGRLLYTCKAADSRAAAVTTDRLLTTVALAPNGEMFLECTASVGNTYSENVRLWDARTGKLAREIGEGGRPIALSPDGLTLATGGKSVSLWDLKSGERIRQLFGFLKRTQSLAFSPDGRLVYAGGSWGTTNVWEVDSGRHLLTLFALSDSHDGRLTDDWVAHRPDGSFEGSPGAERYLAWRMGDELHTAKSPGAHGD